MDTSDWRSQLLPDSRLRITNKILDSLKRHLRVSGSVLLELQKIAEKFEERIFMSAISQSDYLRKISLKMLTMETKSHNTIANNILPSQGNFGIAPISVAVSNALRNQNNTGLNSTYKTNIPAEVRPGSSTVPLTQEKEYPLTHPDRFKRKRVSLGNTSYSSERTESEIPKDPSTTATVIHDHNNLFLQSEVFNFAGQMEPSKVVSLGLENIFDVVANNAMWLNSVANEAKGVFKTWPHEKMKYEEDLQRLTDELVKKDELIAQLKEENINLAKKSEREKYELSAQLESSKKACENANTLLKDANKSLEEVRKKNSDLGKSFGKLSKIKTEAV